MHVVGDMAYANSQTSWSSFLGRPWQRSTPRISQVKDSTLFRDERMLSCYSDPLRFSSCACDA
jgi:hypothetical protein